MCIQQKPLCIIGTLPDTAGIGGVTRHVERLLQALDNRGVSYRFVDYKKESIRYILRIITCSKVIHLHCSNKKFQFLCIFWAFLCHKKSIFTIHSDFKNNKFINKLFLRLSVFFASCPIAINQSSYEICKKINSKTVLVSVFLPPIFQDKLDIQTEHLLKQMDKNKIWVSTNAFNISYDNNGNEVYGIEFLIEFFSKNSQRYILLISDPSGNYQKRYPGTYENIYFVNYPHSYFELLKHMDVFVRNTSTDGDSISVREALYLGLKALCTDVVDRPNGVILFKYNDEQSLKRALGNVKKDGRERGAEENVACDTVTQIVAIYSSFLKESESKVTERKTSI